MFAGYGAWPMAPHQPPHIKHLNLAIFLIAGFFILCELFVELQVTIFRQLA
jgi:hypothetical protein